MRISLVLAWLTEQIKEDSNLAEKLEGRIFPDQAPRGTKNPCLVYQMMGSDFEEYLDDDEVKEAQLSIQIRIYEDSRLGANDTRDAVKTLLTDNQCGRKSIEVSGEDQTFRILRSKVGSYSDSYEENSSSNNDDYGARFLWSVDAGE